MHFDEYIESLRQARLAEATIAAYIRELGHFRAYCKTNRLRVTQVTPKVVTAYLGFRQSIHPSQGEAVRRRMSALSTYFHYVGLVTNGRIRNPLAPLRRPRRQRPNAKPVDDVVLEALMAGITVPRDKAMVMLFASSGLRLSELVSLNKDSIQIEVTPRGDSAQVIGVGRVIGKGQREREFLVDLPTLTQLHAYGLDREQDDIPALFVSNRRQRMNQRSIQHMLHLWCRRLGLDRIHPHALRHSAGTTWHRLGMDTLKISQLLGHASVATTELYILPDAARLKAEYYASMEMLARRGTPALPEPDDA